LLNQLGRSSTSVSANLAEGEGRTRSTGHYRQFLLISRGSLVESIDHFSSLEILEDAWVDDPRSEAVRKNDIESAASMRAKWEELLVDFDGFLEKALDPLGGEGVSGRAEKILRLAREEGKLAETPSLTEPAPFEPVSDQAGVTEES
jgi:four helix bundle protein